MSRRKTIIRIKTKSYVVQLRHFPIDSVETHAQDLDNFYYIMRPLRMSKYLARVVTKKAKFETNSISRISDLMSFRGFPSAFS